MNEIIDSLQRAWMAVSDLTWVPLDEDIEWLLGRYGYEITSRAMTNIARKLKDNRLPHRSARWPPKMPQSNGSQHGGNELTMGYFNMFDEWAMDPKVHCRSEENAKQDTRCCYVCRNIGDTESTPDEEVATFMRISIKEVIKTKEVFAKKGFISGSGWGVPNWEKRQAGQSESWQRVRRHRDKARNVTVTLQESNSNATETLPRGRKVLTLLTYLLTIVQKRPNFVPQQGEAGQAGFFFARLGSPGRMERLRGHAGCPASQADRSGQEARG